KIVTPLHDAPDGRIFAVAELYYGAKQVLDIQQAARLGVTLATISIGALAVLALYFLVDRAGKTIVSQRLRLLRNLDQSRTLARENRALQLGSDRLRHQANDANEHLLAQVGSDLHDGPIQLLTLL